HCADSEGSLLARLSCLSLEIDCAETEPHDEVKDTMPCRPVDHGLNRLGIIHSFTYQLSETSLPAILYGELSKVVAHCRKHDSLSELLAMLRKNPLDETPEFCSRCVLYSKPKRYAHQRCNVVDSSPSSSQFGGAVAIHLGQTVESPLVVFIRCIDCPQYRFVACH